MRGRLNPRHFLVLVPRPTNPTLAHLISASDPAKQPAIRFILAGSRPVNWLKIQLTLNLYSRLTTRPSAGKFLSINTRLALTNGVGAPNNYLIGRKYLAGKGKEMKMKVTFEVKTTNEFNYDTGDIYTFEHYLKDLLDKSILPALSVEMIPLTLNVTKKRGN